MTESKITSLRKMDTKSLVNEKTKLLSDLYLAKASLANTGRKSSKDTRELKKQIARIETVISEQILSRA